jgi:hypothetical protein
VPVARAVGDGYPTPARVFRREFAAPPPRAGSDRRKRTRAGPVWARPRAFAAWPPAAALR